MNAFKEWLSDYLRYFVLILALLLALGAIFLGIKLYQSAQMEEGDPDSITVISGAETESERQSEPQTEAVSETETDAETETEKITEKETETLTEKKTAETLEETEAGDNAGTRNETTEETQPANSAASPVVILNQQETQPQTEAAQTEPPTEAPQPVTETETDPPEPVYLTMTGACYIRSYADYGDNIIGEYPAGTVVEFLEDVGGWYKVQIDGMIGYMGARFFK